MHLLRQAIPGSRANWKYKSLPGLFSSYFLFSLNVFLPTKTKANQRGLFVAQLGQASSIAAMVLGTEQKSHKLIHLTRSPYKLTQINTNTPKIVLN